MPDFDPYPWEPPTDTIAERALAHAEHRADDAIDLDQPLGWYEEWNGHADPATPADECPICGPLLRESYGNGGYRMAQEAA